MSASKTLTIQKAKSIQGSLTVSGDKSISHRALILSALGKGGTKLSHFLSGEDCMATAQALKSMGVSITFSSPTDLQISGVGKKGFTPPKETIDCGNSGTTMRLLSGLLAGQPFSSQLTGDISLCARPMQRIVEPLTLMGAEIKGNSTNALPPLTIQGRELKGTTHHLKIASAQVKSSLLLAGLYAKGKTTVIEPRQSRDHTERMMRYFGINLKSKGLTHTIDPNSEIHLKDLQIPGDISSAAFFVVAASFFPKAHLKIEQVGLNPTRSAFLEVLKRMGAEINIQVDPDSEKFEPIGTIEIHGRELKSTEISGDEIPLLIDELPVLAIAAAKATGTTQIRNAEELRVKESDRVRTICDNLKKLGVKVEELPDGMIIEGPTDFKGGVTLPSYGDHRIAMSMAIAGLTCNQPILIEDVSCIQTSFPDFEPILNTVVRYA